MSQNLDPRIDAYIAKSPAFAQPILQRLRALVHRGCPNVTETIKWSMPYFQVDGAMLAGMAAFKAHCAFGFWHQGMEKVIAADGRSEDDAMGSLGRLTALSDVPDERTMLRYLKAALVLNASGAPARPKPAAASARKELPVPEDLAKALTRQKAAAKTFAALPPSHRKEYIQWVTEAKRPETRTKRLATTVEWLAEGKSRNWKYENC
jgi:uncharacterized protein YdeI (YjbR/CyaY-like superfamily)